MIETLADFLQELLEKEQQVLSKQKIKHRPTIGRMYEGLTSSILEKAIFKNLNLKLYTNGFIKNNKGTISDELDVLLVVGDRKQIPYTNQCIFTPEQVVAVFQVKKNLFSKDIGESYLNMKNVVKIFSEEDCISDHQMEMLRDSALLILSKDVTRESKKTYSRNEEFIFSSLRLDAIVPVRIVLGYNGFKSEIDFRKGFIKYLDQNVTTDVKNKKHGYGPANFPSQIICKNYSILKNNGLPFGIPLIEKRWPVLSSYDGKPLYFMLEYIWTRLSYMFAISVEIFGEDMFREQVISLLDAEIINVNGSYGWQYFHIGTSQGHLSKSVKGFEWKPVFISETQYNLISYLCCYEKIHISKSKFLAGIAGEENTTIDDIINKLCDTGFVFIENNNIKLLTKECACAILPNGRFTAAENSSGR
jgi:hypothetical protein